MTGGISDDNVLGKLLQHMNSHVPSKRPLLSDLLESKDPHYLAKDGSRYEISPSELALIKHVLRQSGHGDIRLPILLVADSSQSQSTWRVEGEQECAVISHVLQRSDPERRNVQFLYAAHLSLIRRALPTTTACIFVP